MPPRRRAPQGEVSRPAVDLRADGVSKVTQARYAKAISDFGDFVTERGFHVVSLVDTPSQLSELLADYGQFLWNSGAPKYRFANALAGMHHRFPQLKGHLQLAWRCLSTWQQHEVSEPIVPLPATVWRAMIVSLISSRQKLKVRFAIYLWVQFVCMLRPSEGLQLKRSHVAIGSDIASSSTGGQCLSLIHI